MDYETCLKACIEALQNGGPEVTEDDLAIYSGYPVPSATEWADVLEKNSTHDDVDKPFNCMRDYEWRLHVRGVKTVLEAEISNFIALAESSGLSLESLLDRLATSAPGRSDLPTKH